jgi:hypothetical protein
MQRILGALDAHPICAVRASALSLRHAIEGDASARAQAALRSPCWRLQAAALVVLRRLDVAPDASAPLPSVLRAHLAVQPDSPGKAQ